MYLNFGTMISIKVDFWHQTSSLKPTLLFETTWSNTFETYFSTNFVKVNAVNYYSASLWPEPPPALDSIQVWSWVECFKNIKRRPSGFI